MTDKERKKESNTVHSRFIISLNLAYISQQQMKIKHKNLSLIYEKTDVSEADADQVRSFTVYRSA